MSDKIKIFREGTKLETIIKMLSSKDGTTLEALVEVTSWQPHTVRAIFANLKRQHNIEIQSTKSDNKRIYRIIEPTSQSVE